MKRLTTTMRGEQVKKFARFLEEHPGFSPLLLGEDAIVCGFQVGSSFLRVEDMEELIATRPQFDAQESALLLKLPSPSSRRRV